MREGRGGIVPRDRRVTSTIEEGISMPRADDRNIVRIHQARAGSPEALGQLLDGCRGYLMRIARDELDPRLQAKGGASDLVQETFLEAQRDFAAFTGDSEAELLAWLRHRLRYRVAKFVRSYRQTAEARGRCARSRSTRAAPRPSRARSRSPISPRPASAPSPANAINCWNKRWSTCRRSTGRSSICAIASGCRSRRSAVSWRGRRTRPGSSGLRRSSG